VDNLNKQLSIQGAAVEKLYSSMMLLEQKIAEAKRQKEVHITSRTIMGKDVNSHA
jgi:phage shock protein A